MKGKYLSCESQAQTKPRKLEPLVHKIPMGGRNNLAGLRLPANYSGQALQSGIIIIMMC